MTTTTATDERAGAKLISTPEQARAWRVAQSHLRADRRFRRSANPLAAALRRAGLVPTR